MVVSVVVVLTGAAAINVSAIHYTSTDGACGTGATGPGFKAVGGATVTETVTVSGGLFAACTVDSVVATTSGFSISGANVPLTVLAGKSAALTFTVHTPKSVYSGVLTIDVE